MLALRATTADSKWHPRAGARPLDISAQIRRRARRSGGVDAALGLLRAGPAAGADVGAVFHRVGAGPAADRGVAERHQRVLRQVMLAGIGLEVGLVPVGERVELQLA